MSRELDREPQPQPAMTFQVWSDEQIAAFKGDVIAAVRDELTVNWLPRRPMTLEETAEFFSVSTRAIRDWTNAGALGSWKHGHTVLYLPDHIAAFVDAGRRG